MLFKLTVLCLASIFRSYRRSNIWVVWVTRLARTILFPSEDHFTFVFFCQVLILRPRRVFFDSLSAKWQWRLYSTSLRLSSTGSFYGGSTLLFSLVGSLKRVCLLTLLTAARRRWCDVTAWHTSLQEGPQNNLFSWSRSGEIVKVKDSKVLLPVVEPRPEAPQIWLFQFPRYNFPRHYCPPWKFPRFEWNQLFTVEVPIWIHTFLVFEVCFKEDRPTGCPKRVQEIKLLFRSGLIWSLSTFSSIRGTFIHVLRCFLPYQAIGVPEILLGLQPPQLRTKATTANLGVSTIPAHGQSTSNVLNHIEITHLSGARHHHSQALEIHNLH